LYRPDPRHNGVYIDVEALNRRFNWSLAVYMDSIPSWSQLRNRPQVVAGFFVSGYIDFKLTCARTGAGKSLTSTFKHFIEAFFE
jgi:hypothetical protein